MNFAFIEKFGPVVARVLLSLIFIMGGISKIGGFEGTAGWMASAGLPMVNVLLVLTIIIELGGGLMVLLGYRAREAALVIFLFLIPVTLVFHTNFADQTQMLMFMKNLGIMGGMLMVAAMGSGPFSMKK
jgi:putative oxidoreductase